MELKICGTSRTSRQAAAERCPEKVGLVDGMMPTYAGEEWEYYLKARKL